MIRYCSLNLKCFFAKNQIVRLTKGRCGAIILLQHLSAARLK